MRIRVNDEKGLANKKAGFQVTAAGEYDFPDGDEYQGWLRGQVARGTVTILGTEADSYPPEAIGPTSGSVGVSEPASPALAPGAEGPTSGSTTGEPVTDPSDPNRLAPGAEGLTPGSTPGPPPAEVDEEKDLRDASATQHPEKAEKLREQARGGKPKR